MTLTAEQIEEVRNKLQIKGQGLPSSQFNSAERAARINQAWNKYDQEEKYKQTEGRKPGFFSRIGQDIAKRGKNIVREVGETAKGEQHPISGGLQTVGQVAGIAGDIFGEILGTGVKALDKATGGFLSESAKKILQTPLGQQAISALAAGMDTYQVFKEEHPEFAANFEAFVNIGDLFLLGRGTNIKKAFTMPLKSLTSKTKAKMATSVSKLKKGAEQKFKKEQSSFIRKLVQPEQTKKVKEAQVARTTEVGSSIFKRSEIAPSKMEEAAEKIVAEIPGISSQKTIQGNYNITKKYNENLAVELENSLEGSKGAWSINNLKGVIKNTEVPIGAKNIDGSKAVRDIKKYIITLGEKAQKNPKGAFKLSKEFRKNISKVYGENIWIKDTPIANYIKSINRNLNTFVESRLPEGKTVTGISFKESMAKQTKLYEVMDNLVPKAAKEADVAYKRVLDKVSEILGTKNRVVQGIAAAVGIGGLGAAANFAPAAALLGMPFVGAMVSRKFIPKSKVKKVLSKIIDAAEKTLPQIKDETTFKIFNADLLMLKELLSEFGED